MAAADPAGPPPRMVIDDRTSNSRDDDNLGDYSQHIACASSEGTAGAGLADRSGQKLNRRRFPADGASGAVLPKRVFACREMPHAKQSFQNAFSTMAQVHQPTQSEDRTQKTREAVRRVFDALAVSALGNDAEHDRRE